MNAVRVSFLIATDIFVIAILVSLLAGCVTTPQRYRNGDFVSNMASTEVGVRASALAASLSESRA
jgi:hypothetical protein